MFKQIVLFALLCSSALAQVKVDVLPFSAITAKSAKLEPLDDKVVVFLTDRDPGERTGALLTITSQEKWATPYSESLSFRKTTQPNEWILFAKPGTYRIAIWEFNLETGPAFSHVEVIIPGVPPPKDPPVDPPVDPPTGDFASIRKLADELADALADPPVRKALSVAYGAAIEVIEAKGLNYADAAAAVTIARFAELSKIPMTKEWNGLFLKPIGIALGKLVASPDVAGYVQGIRAIQAGLAD